MIEDFSKNRNQKKRIFQLNKIQKNNSLIEINPTSFMKKRVFIPYNEYQNNYLKENYDKNLKLVKEENGLLCVSIDNELDKSKIFEFCLDMNKMSKLISEEENKNPKKLTKNESKNAEEKTQIANFCFKIVESARGKQSYEMAFDSNYPSLLRKNRFADFFETKGNKMNFNLFLTFLLHL
jgi:hypothetical protein